MNDRRKMNHYKFSKKARHNSIEVGQRGFLCSCNFREKDCVREAYNLLNKYNSSDDTKKAAEPAGDAKAGAAKTDVLDSLEDEINQLKADSASRSTHVFNSADSGVKNVVFIRTTIPDPVDLATKIVRDMSETKTQQTRYLQRLVPIEQICAASVPKILEAFAPLVSKYFSGEPVTFSVVFNHRHNHDLSKDEVIKQLAEAVNTANSDHKVNLKEAQLCVIVEVIKGLALIAVIPDYFKYKKFNLHAITAPLDDGAAKVDESAAQLDDVDNSNSTEEG